MILFLESSFMVNEPVNIRLRFGLTELFIVSIKINYLLLLSNLAIDKEFTRLDADFGKIDLIIFG